MAQAHAATKNETPTSEDASQDIFEEESSREWRGLSSQSEEALDEFREDESDKPGPELWYS